MINQLSRSITCVTQPRPDLCLIPCKSPFLNCLTQEEKVSSFFSLFYFFFLAKTVVPCEMRKNYNKVFLTTKDIQIL